MRAHSWLPLAVLLLLQVPASGQQVGTIKGKIVLQGKSPLAGAPPLLLKNAAAAVQAGCVGADVPNQKLLVDEKSGGIAVVVYLRKAPADMPANLKMRPMNPVVFDQKDCRFLPHVLPVRVGQTVNCVTQDAVAHNVHTNGFLNPSENFLIPANSKVVTPVTLKTAEMLPVRVNCDLHGWMEAYWVVTDHPYVGITNEQGEFEIADLPVGEHAFTVWHETGYLPVGEGRTFKVTVKAGEQRLPEIPVPAAHFDAALKKGR